MVLTRNESAKELRAMLLEAERELEAATRCSDVNEAPGS
jgi:hypothetical protein